MDFNEYFIYDENYPSLLINKVSRGVAKEGEPVKCSANGRSYLKLRLAHRIYRLHRVVWELHNGPIPEGLMVDHIDGDKTNNRIHNLRLATHSQNMMNKRKQANGNSLLPKGIYENRTGYYCAQIRANGKVYTKASKDITLLTEWLFETRSELHGEFANHG